MLDRRLSEAGTELNMSQATALYDELRRALERTLNEGMPIGSAGVRIEVEARGDLFSDGNSRDELQEKMNALVRAYWRDKASVGRA